MTRILSALLTVMSLSGVLAAEPVKLQERFSPDQIDHVSIKTVLTGKLAVMVEGQKTAVVIAGKSVMEFEERPLTQDPDGNQRSLRVYRTCDIDRSLGDRRQKSTLRPEVSRQLVMLSQDGVKAPFSPDGPLTWNEIDLVRSDFFLPRLITGLLPTVAVKPGDRWKATSSAVSELTSLSPILDGGIEIEYLAEVVLNQRRLAKLGLRGIVRGTSEDGPTRQTLEGLAYFDHAASRLSYLKVNGVHELLSQDGEGRLEGSMTMTRDASTKFTEISDEKIRGLILVPNEKNSLLLYENPELGVRFLYPRRWRVGVVQGQQIALEEPKGGGVLITVLPVNKIPSVEQYQREILTYLKNQKATHGTLSSAEVLSEASCRMVRFHLDAELGNEKIMLHYGIASHKLGGATIAARVPSRSASELTPEVLTILQGLTFMKSSGQ